MEHQNEITKLTSSNEWPEMLNDVWHSMEHILAQAASTLDMEETVVSCTSNMRFAIHWTQRLRQMSGAAACWENDFVSQFHKLTPTWNRYAQDAHHMQLITSVSQQAQQSLHTSIEQHENGGTSKQKLPAAFASTKYQVNELWDTRKCKLTQSKQVICPAHDTPLF